MPAWQSPCQSLASDWAEPADTHLVADWRRTKHMDRLTAITNTGQELAGRGRGWQGQRKGRAEQGRAGQGRAGQGRAGQGRAEQGLGRD